MGFSVTFRLSVMMFIQFFIWGAWYVTAPLYLGKIGFTGADFGWTYSVGPIAAMISPFFVGMIADRLFATEKVLGVLHLLGGGAMLMAASKMQGPDPSASAINLIFFAHMLCYFPPDRRPSQAFLDWLRQAQDHRDLRAREIVERLNRLTPAQGGPPRTPAACGRASRRCHNVSSNF